MVGLQMLMTTSISFPGPIMPLLLPELGVVTVEAIGIWTGLITGSMSFVAAFASRSGAGFRIGAGGSCRCYGPRSRSPSSPC